MKPVVIASTTMFARPVDRFEFEPVEANLRETLKFFAHANDNGQIVESEDLVMISSGINYGVFNTVLLKDRVESEIQLIHFINEASAYFLNRQERWSFWLCHDLLAPNVLRRLRRVMEAHHMRFLSEPPGMIAAGLVPVKRLPFEELDIRMVDNARERLAFAAILSTTFDLPFSICNEIYSVERSWRGGYKGWVAYLRGEPVATTACVVAAGVAGIYSVGTMPEFRRRGYAEQLMRHVLDQVSRESGVQRSILQATPEGYRIYQKMGYRRVTQFSIFLTERAGGERPATWP